MSELIPWDRPRGSVHDLATLDALSATRTNVLCVSDRTLYIIQNWAALDVDFRARFAKSVDPQSGYYPVEPASDHWELYLSVVNNLRLEVEDMSCDVVAALEEIRDAIIAGNAQAVAGGAVCCGYTFEPGTYYETDPGAGSPALKCDLSYSYANVWKSAVDEVYHQWAMGGFPSTGVLAAILDEFDLPGQALLEIATFGAASVLPMLESLWQTATAELVPSITCALFNAPDALTAKADIYAAIDAYGAVETAAELMKDPITYNSLNKVFDGTWSITHTGYDCDLCGEVCFPGDPYFDLGYGKLDPDGTLRPLIAERNPTNDDWYVAAYWPYNVRIEIVSIDNIYGDYPDFPDYRIGDWGVNCAFQFPIIEVAYIGDAVGRIDDGAHLNVLQHEDAANPFVINCIVSEIP